MYVIYDLDKTAIFGVGASVDEAWQRRCSAPNLQPCEPLIVADWVTLNVDRAFAQVHDLPH